MTRAEKIEAAKELLQEYSKTEKDALTSFRVWLHEEGLKEASNDSERD